MVRHAWKTWLLRFCGFLGLVLLAVSAAHWLGLGYWQPFINNQALKIHLYQRDRIAPDILFLGTSKTNRAVIPTLVEAELAGAGMGTVTAFCLGQRGVSAHTQWIVLRDVLETNQSPRLVVLEVTPGMLNANHGGFRDVLRFYASPGDLVRAVPRLRTAAEWRAAGRGAFRGMTSLYLYAWCGLFRGGQERQLTTIRLLQGAHYGIEAPRAVERLSEMPAGERGALFRSMRDRGRRLFMRDYEIGGLPAAGLERIIRLCRREEIGLVLFNPPVTPEYRRALYRPEEHTGFLEYIERIARREGIPFLDLDDGRHHLTVADFHDFGHLNVAGARVLSQYMARDILAPALK